MIVWGIFCIFAAETTKMRDGMRQMMIGIKVILEHAYDEFARCTTLKVQNDEGLIIGSVNGNVKVLQVPRSW